MQLKNLLSGGKSYQRPRLEGRNLEGRNFEAVATLRAKKDRYRARERSDGQALCRRRRRHRKITAVPIGGTPCARPVRRHRRALNNAAEQHRQDNTAATLVWQLQRSFRANVLAKFYMLQASRELVERSKRIHPSTVRQAHGSGRTRLTFLPNRREFDQLLSRNYPFMINDKRLLRDASSIRSQNVSRRCQTGVLRQERCLLL